jgi:hypothetical protein
VVRTLARCPPRLGPLSAWSPTQPRKITKLKLRSERSVWIDRLASRAGTDELDAANASCFQLLLVGQIGAQLEHLQAVEFLIEKLASLVAGHVVPQFSVADLLIQRQGGLVVRQPSC